jgi:hypothetical protein
MHNSSQSFRDLKVWRKAHELVLAVYGLTASFPKHETWGLCRQFRASVSIPANIAEGVRRRGKPDEARYLASELGPRDPSRLTPRLEEVSKLLNG